MHELRLDMIPHQEVRKQSPSRFSPHFDPQHDHLHFYLHASYIHHGQILIAKLGVSFIDIHFLSSANEGHSVDTPFCNPHLTSHGG